MGALSGNGRPCTTKAAYSLPWLALEILAQTEGYVQYDELVSAFKRFSDVVHGAQRQVQEDAQRFAAEWKDEKVAHDGQRPSAAHQESIYFAGTVDQLRQAYIAESISTDRRNHRPGNAVYIAAKQGRTRPLDDRAIRLLNAIRVNRALSMR